MPVWLIGKYDVVQLAYHTERIADGRTYLQVKRYTNWKINV